MNQENTTVNSAVVHLDDDDFETAVLRSDQPVLVDFWADWCGPCRRIAPAVEQLAEDFAGRVRVAKVDVDANPMTTHQYGIRGIPALLLFRDGQEVERMVGVQPKEAIARIIENHL